MDAPTTPNPARGILADWEVEGLIEAGLITPDATRSEVLNALRDNLFPRETPDEEIIEVMSDSSGPPAPATGDFTDLPEPAEEEAETEARWTARLDLEQALETEPPPYDFVLPGLLSGTVGAIIGAGSAGKTMLALQLAATVAGGRPTLGLDRIIPKWEQTTGRVVYITAEDPNIVLRHRLHDLAGKWDLSEKAALYERLEMVPLFGARPNIMEPDWGGWLEQVAEGTRLIILDTFSRFHLEEEADAGKMANLLGMLEAVCYKTGTTILFLHHSSKAAALNSANTQQASRGSSVLTDNARWQVNLAAMTEAEAKNYVLNDEQRKLYARLTFSKLNYSRPLPGQWYKRGEGGLLTLSRLDTPSLRVVGAPGENNVFD